DPAGGAHRDCHRRAAAERRAAGSGRWRAPGPAGRDQRRGLLDRGVRGGDRAGFGGWRRADRIPDAPRPRGYLALHAREGGAMRVVMKFGGTSMAGAERIRHAAGLALSAGREHEVVTVVSAMDGMTEKLLDLADGAAAGKHTEMESLLATI